jgi:carbonic anhydrase
MCIECMRGGMTRRGLLAGAAGLAAATVAPTALVAAEAPAAAVISPDEALKRLQEGNARYVANASTNRDYSAGRAARAQGQRPFAAILGCSDSRVGPEIVFDQGPGELFIVRVAGNFVNDDGLASLEYAVAVLGVSLILVLGHSGCGAVEAAIKQSQEGAEPLPGDLPRLVDAIKPAVAAAKALNPDDLLDAAIVENVKLAVAALITDEVIVGRDAAAGKVGVVGGVYDIATGKVTPI